MLITNVWFQPDDNLWYRLKYRIFGVKYKLCKISLNLKLDNRYNTNYL